MRLDWNWFLYINYSNDIPICEESDRIVPKLYCLVGVKISVYFCAGKPGITRYVRVMHALMASACLLVLHLQF